MRPCDTGMQGIDNAKSARLDFISFELRLSGETRSQ